MLPGNLNQFQHISQHGADHNVAYPHADQDNKLLGTPYHVGLVPCDDEKLSKLEKSSLGRVMTLVLAYSSSVLKAVKIQEHDGRRSTKAGEIQQHILADILMRMRFILVVQFFSFPGDSILHGTLRKTKLQIPEPTVLSFPSEPVPESAIRLYVRSLLAIGKFVPVAPLEG